MSISKFERGKYIRSRLMHQAICGIGRPDALDYFQNLYELIDDIDTAGNPKTDYCANHPAYLEALSAWQKAHKAEAERHTRSRSL